MTTKIEFLQTSEESLLQGGFSIDTNRVVRDYDTPRGPRQVMPLRTERHISDHEHIRCAPPPSEVSPYSFLNSLLRDPSEQPVRRIADETSFTTADSVQPYAQLSSKTRLKLQSISDFYAARLAQRDNRINRAHLRPAALKKNKCIDVWMALNTI